MASQPVGTKRKPSSRNARGETVRRFFASVPWGQWWGEFLDVTQDGKSRYPTTWSFAKVKGKSDSERKLIFEMIGPEPELAPGEKLRAPRLGDWESRRAKGVWDHADPATRRKIERALKERFESVDRVRRAAALVTIQEISRWEKASEQIDLAFAGKPLLPNEPPDSPRNRARSQAYFQMHMQASQNIGRALIGFISLCGSEPADEEWLAEIAKASEK
jgi:hypothetical protein